MGRNKTTGDLTKRYSFGLHPQYEEDAKAIEIVEDLINQGWGVRQIMTDAILRAGGARPEMFSGREGMTMQSMESLFNRFAGEMLAEMGKRSIGANDEQSQETDEDDAWVNNFAKGFMARQSQVLGEDE